MKNKQVIVIMDPMFVLTFGYGNCTGISIVLFNALRAAGIPARLAGTSAWNDNLDNGNH
jgi:transglutaminase-like putative cysteine protease